MHALHSQWQEIHQSVFHDERKKLHNLHYRYDHIFQHYLDVKYKAQRFHWYQNQQRFQCMSVLQRKQDHFHDLSHLTEERQRRRQQLHSRFWLLRLYHRVQIFGFQSLWVTSCNNFIISILVHKNVFCNKVSIADEKRVLVIVWVKFDGVMEMCYTFM